MTVTEQIETARLVLRRPRASDAAAIFERYAGQPETTRFLSWPTHTTLAETQTFIAFSDAEWRRWPAGPLLIESLDTRQLLGSTGLAFSSLTEASTGYVLARDAWGRGYATEALAAVVDLAQRLAVTRLTALCHPSNGASARVLQKCGFTNEGMIGLLEFPNLDAAEPQQCLQFVRRLVPML